jgi:hypothetical protein
MKKPSVPELKFSEFKVPRPLRDVYQDLRDRRLLPLVGLLLVAIVAVPFLLSDGGESAPPRAVAPPPEEPVRNAQLTVVKSAPGLREPSKRLAARRAKDPFRQHFTGAAASSEPVTTEAGSAAAVAATPVETGGSTVESGGEPTPPSVESSPGHSGQGSGDSGPGGNNPEDGIVLYAFAADLTITKTAMAPSGKKVTEQETRHNILPSTVLPGSKSQVITYMGVSPKTRKPLVLVSTDVTGVFGDGKCVAGTDSCQLLEMKLTFPQTFVYGEAGVRYKVNIFNIEPVVTGHS